MIQLLSSPSGTFHTDGACDDVTVFLDTEVTVPRLLRGQVSA